MNAVSAVDKLWFPVKLGHICRSVLRPVRRVGWGGLLAAWLAVCGGGALGCGYAPAYGGERPVARLTVVAAPSRAADSAALVGILEGLRAELSRAGVLTSGGGYPRVVVELVRVDERTAGQSVAANPTNLGGEEVVLGRGSAVGVTGRAWIIESPEARSFRDTGDVRRVRVHAAGSSSGVDHEAREAALVVAGRLTGAALARRLMGEVEPSQEPM